MANISLIAYQNKLEGLLEESRFDEVIAHSRHILKTCPKNLRAYRQLGGALFAASRWQEAVEVLRRLLGSLPQDFKAHSLLAQAHQQLEQYDQAIWHAERAFDQQPNNQDIISLLRSLYRKHRGQEIERLQLTASALAQQHIRNNLLQEALNVLDAALEPHPNRIDLQLLRARTLWLAGRRTDAAETALEVLNRLSYSRTANRIMTELWLSEQRPSDAQLYLGRIEELDPYLAWQLASGEPAAESLLTLEELDDSALSQQELTIVNPDWLNSLGAIDTAKDEGSAGGLEAPFSLEASAVPPTADSEDPLSDDEIEDLFGELVADESAADSDVAEDEEDEAEAVFSLMDEKGFFQDSQADSAGDEAGDDLTNLLAQLDDDEDDISWLTEIQQSDMETAAESEGFPEYMNHDDGEAELEEPEGSPDGQWLAAALREMIAEEDDRADLFADDEQLQTLLGKVNETQPIHPDDIEFWLNQEGIDLDEEEAPEEEEAGDFLDEEDGAFLDHSWLDDEPLADEIGYEGDSGSETLELIEDWEAELDEDDDDYVDWLNEDDLDVFELEAAEEIGDFAADAPHSEGDPPSPMADEGASSDETARAWGLTDAEQLADFVEEEIELSAVEASPDWLNAMAPGLDAVQDDDGDDDPAGDKSVASSPKDFAWLSDIVDEETGEMEAVAPQAALPAPHFRFSRPPLWLMELLQNPPSEATLAAASRPLLEKMDESVEDISFDVLDLELETDNFDFDAPTEKISPVGSEAAAKDARPDEFDFDSYFDFDAPTEKISPISAEDLAKAIDFDELGLEDEDFDFERPTEKISVEKDAEEIDFDDLGLDDDFAPPPDSDDLPEWLDYDDDASGRPRRGGL